MKATKITMTVTIEVLHIDIIPGLLQEVCQEILADNTQGELAKSDGDLISWSTKTKNVVF